ncbi:type VI secretion system ATPase TssH [Halomonas sp. MCCC 1A17488]|uniref:type VI secretion system ATPase TssH n=1 Tax=unclassified Halomonas TaxID=2609666 RepID=UPI0018D266B4|nr:MULTISPECIES: type VI secretion system ATPase TssH [unclassified Halomonas]MCE8017131.1 type VI secretion system ATPase TssH [Halomonas sp. MCCC 1A17488]MCG3240464.1 type VI secretion system ATPase TssH [Halomonas sp. MCCC 1A17488]QPP49676.1 type VI secretion system ATPase TssH [Halomonas sp. SS10-MC5]
MLRVELPALIGRLNAVSRQGLEQAAVLCAEQQAPEVTAGHLLLALIDQPLCDLRCLLDGQGIDVHELRARLAEETRPPRDLAVTTPSFSPLLVELLQDAWLLATTEFAYDSLRSGLIFTALLHNVGRYLGPRSAALLAEINREGLRRGFERLAADSAEAPRAEPNEGGRRQDQATQGDSALARFATSLTEQARRGELDPVLCRDPEIDQMLDILGRRRKNNPIVIGDAGVGKSAVVEGLAARIVEGRVPAALADVELMSLDLGALQAGAAVKGEFEKRLKAVIEEVKAAPRPILLFIDEAHTLIGAGNQEGGGDAANLLKPALARGELRTIAATTWREYKKYFEKDPALSRRFQPVALAEPSIDQALVILRGLRDTYETAHGVLVGDSGLRAAAELSARYLAGRKLPDKAIDVLDTACARLSQALDTPPRRLSHLQSEHLAARRERDQLDRERLLGRSPDATREAELDVRLARLEAEVERLEAAWADQRECVDAIIALHRQLLAAGQVEANPEQPVVETAIDDETGGENDADSTIDGEAAADAVESDDSAADVDLHAQLAAHEARLAELQQEYALVNASVEEAQIAQVIGDWTGVPVERMTSDELTRLTELPEHLGRLVQGQDTAIERVHRHLLTARADLRRPGRPLGAFLLVGPSGVGKTETVVQIAERLYGGRQFLTTINMSEYQEKHTVSRLIGSPPGYVGFGEGGLLTEAIRQRPYSVVLLDEVEKAHPDVLNLFYQAFDKGELADGEGRLIDCKNVVFFLTSNLGYEAIVAHVDDPAALDDALYPVLAGFFKPALLARMEVVPYFPLGADTLRDIVVAKLDTLAERIRTRHRQAEVVLDEALRDAICVRATRSENGARMLESVIDGELLPPVSRALLDRLARREPVTRVALGVDAAGAFTAEVV